MPSAGRLLGEISSRIDAQIGPTAAMAAGAGGGGGGGDSPAPSRPLTLDEKLRKVRELRTSSGKAIEAAVQGAVRVESLDTNADPPGV